MYIELGNGRTIDIPIDLWLQLSDLQIQKLIASGTGFHVANPLHMIELDYSEIVDNDFVFVEKIISINGELPEGYVIEDDIIDDELDYDDFGD